MSIDTENIDDLILDGEEAVTPKVAQPAPPRLSFPEAPGYTRDYVELPSGEPRVDRRWYRYRDTVQTLDLFWYGMCLYCQNGLWADIEHNGATTIGSSNALTVIERDGREYRFCAICADRPNRVETAIEQSQGIYTAPYEWPESVRKRVLSDPERLRKQLLSEVVAVVPRKGALIRPIAGGDTTTYLVPFDRFENGQVVDANGTTYPITEVEALVPAFPGVKYERAVGMPISSYTGTLLSIVAWRGKDPHVQIPQGRLTAFNSQHISALAPILDPSTETMEEQVARLTRQQERLEQGIHARMVAEATARSWCSEFDQIIDVTGLPPRSVRNVVRGTMTFTHQVNEEVTDELLTRIKNNWTNYIAYSSVTITSIERTPDERTPLITPA